MNKQIKALAEEMVQEIRNLKDLTKENLPEVAKEYVRYNTVMYLMGTIFFGAITLIGLTLLVYGIVHKGYSSEAPDLASICLMLGSFGSFIGVITGMINFSFYLSYKLQPRRMAIQGITSLFKSDS